MRLGRAHCGDFVGWAVVDSAAAALPFETVAQLHDWIEGGAVAPSTRAAIELPSEPLLRPGKILGVGFNYEDHAAEAGSSPPAHPVLFAKLPACVVGHETTIQVDRSLTAFADWEVELAVVVGRPMCRVPADQALDHVLGYTVANDVSARDIQEADGQWFRAKNLATFCPLGPWIMTADAIGDPQALTLTARLNGETVQRASTAEMRFSVADLLSFCSHHFVLEPGDVLLTGTPAGVGMSRQPPRRLCHGDVIEVEVEEIGVLRNFVEERG